MKSFKGKGLSAANKRLLSLFLAFSLLVLSLPAGRYIQAEEGGLTPLPEQQAIELQTPPAASSDAVLEAALPADVETPTPTETSAVVTPGTETPTSTETSAVATQETETPTPTETPAVVTPETETPTPTETPAVATPGTETPTPTETPAVTPLPTVAPDAATPTPTVTPAVTPLPTVGAKKPLKQLVPPPALPSPAPDAAAVGLLEISSPTGAFTRNQSSYNIYTDTNKTMFEVRYRAPNPGTLNNKLVIKIPAYGATFAAIPAVNASVTAVLKSDQRTLILQLADQLTEELSIQIALDAIPLTQAQAEAWMDQGSLQATTIEAREYIHTGALADTEASGQLKAQDVFASMSPTLYEQNSSRSFKAIDTYDVLVSSVADSTNTQLGQNGFGRAGGNDLYAYPGPNPPAPSDPVLRYGIPTVHKSDTPLVEITGIKVYVPDTRLKLIGVSNQGAVAKQTSNVLDSEFDQLWNQWTVGGRQTDAGGDYFIISPNTRYFNIAFDSIVPNDQNKKEVGTLLAGMRLLWQLVDSSNELPYAPDIYTSLQGTDTSVLFQIPGTSQAPTPKTYEHAAPKIRTLAREDRSKVFSAYAPERHHDNSPNNNVTIGSYQTFQLFTLASNLYLRQLITTAGVVYTKEWVPAYTGGPITQHYEFPYEIQPRQLNFKDGNISANPQRINNQNKLSAVRYTTVNAAGIETEHGATDAEIAAINAYMHAQAGGAQSVVFSAADATNVVRKVDVVWEKMVTTNRLAYPVSTQNGLPAYNLWHGGYKVDTLQNYSLISYVGNYFAHSITTHFDYLIASYHDVQKSQPIQNYEMAQVKYTLTATGNESSYESNDKYLWFRFKVPTCPDLWGEPYSTPTGGVLSEFVLHHFSESAPINSGNIGLYIGQYGERIDDLSHPVIKLKMRFGLRPIDGLSAAQQAAIADHVGDLLTGITPEQGLAYFSGAFTAMPKLSGWTFEYSTNQRTGVSWTVPEITNPDGEARQIPLQEGEFFKTLTLKYDGLFSAAHESETDTKSVLYLMKNIMMKTLETNPFTGESINTSSPFINAVVALDGVAHWDNCGEDSLPHSPTNPNEGQNMLAAGASNYLLYRTPYMRIWKTQRITLDNNTPSAFKTPNQQLPTTVQTVFQGAAVTDRFATISYVSKIEGGQAGANILLPFYSNKAIYIEWKDPEIFFDPDSSVFLSVPMTAAGMSYSWVTANDGRRFLKLEMDASVDRPMNDMSVFYPAYSGDVWSVDQFNYLSAGTLRNAFGSMRIGFKTLPGATLGLHNPLGEVYMDYSDLLRQYNAPTAALDQGKTKYVFSHAVPDSLGLIGQPRPESLSLFKYDFSSYQINVIKLAGLAADVIPGVDSVYAWADRRTQFYTHQCEALEALYSVTGPDTVPVYDFTGYIALPRKGLAIKYKDDQQQEQSATGGFDVFLRAKPNILTDNTAQGADNVQLAYTTDPNPSATSTYSVEEPNDWKSVTGVKVLVKNMPKQTAVNLRLNLSTPAKTSLGELTSYIGGSYSYRFAPQSDAFSALLKLGSYVYSDYLVNSTPALVYHDAYNENGLQDQAAEKPLAGIVVELYDTDATTLIDHALSDANGHFALKSYKRDAGQILRIVMPTTANPADATTAAAMWKLTKQSALGFSANLKDSDFNRLNNQLVLPQLLTLGYPNLSAGLVRLPELKVKDVELTVGQTLQTSATLLEYLLGPVPNSAYNLSFSAAADTSRAELSARTDIITGPETMTEATRNISIKGLAPGETTATVTTRNLLGDEVIARYKITVKNVYQDFLCTKVWDDRSNALFSRPTRIRLQLQRSAANEPKENVGAPVDLSGSGDSWTHTFAQQPLYDTEGRLYVYSISETVPPNYKAEYGDPAQGLKVSNTLETIRLDGQKIWLEEGTITRPSSVEIELYRSDDSSQAFASQVVTNSQADAATPHIWPFTFNDLLKYDTNGQEYVYTLKEKTVPKGYSALISDTTITNSNPPDVAIKVEKQWDHTGAPADQRPTAVTINLWRDQTTPSETDTPFDSIELNAGNSWKHTFMIPDGEAQGHSFSMTEEAVKGYTVAYSSAADGTLLAQNTFVMPKVTISGQKSWQSVPEGVSVPAVSFYLWRNNSAPKEGDLPFDTATLAGGLVDEVSKTYTFSDLDQYDPQGQPYVYSVTEKALTGYDTQATDYDFTNRYNPTPLNFDLQAKKQIDGAYPPDEDFSFSLTADDSAYPMPEGSQEGQKTVTRKGLGEVDFGRLSFKLPGSYTYKVQENKGSHAGYTYDASVYSVKILVSDHAGVLSAEVTYEKDGQEASGLVFTNEYRHLLIYDQNYSTQSTPLKSERVFGDSLISSASMYASAADVRTGEGYDFAGWYLDQSCATPVGEATIKSDTTIYAKWKPIVYKIVYDLDGGSVPAEQANPETYTVEQLPLKLTNPLRPGYTFLGWSGSNGETAQTDYEIPQGTTGDLNYKAHWQKNVYTVSFDCETTGHLESEGKKVSDFAQLDQKVPYMAYASAGNSALPNADDYVFVGWSYRYTAADGSLREGTVLDYTRVPIEGDVCFTARFARRPSVTAIAVNGHVLTAAQPTAAGELTLSTLAIPEDAKLPTRVYIGYQALPRHHLVAIHIKDLYGHSLELDFAAAAAGLNVRMPLLAGPLSLAALPTSGTTMTTGPKEAEGSLRVKLDQTGQSLILEGVEHSLICELRFEPDPQYRVNFYSLPEDSQTYAQTTGLYDKEPYGPSPEKEPQRRGYSFLEWNRSADGTGQAFNPQELINGSDVNFYAVWVKQLSLKLSAEKIVQGAGAPTEDFRFRLKALAAANPLPAGGADGVAYASRSGAGSVEFGEILFTREGRYDYQVTEEKGSASAWTYDETLYGLSIEVRREGLALVTNVRLTRDGKAAEKLLFTNVYASPTTKPTDKKVPRTGESPGAEAALGYAFLSVSALALWRRKRRAKN